ncbi:hypothetical protein EKO27_g7988 [Xylaria grammica]|uniref:Zn(2)-C6 fungal-type domain-containing protein n=1 Tax=Xylaria grammica TaxID=363999 RepID=A0A439CY28_9PEZI|nr:hypothetical protein EKO27_g7988 [Xylaria grammica]
MSSWVTNGETDPPRACDRCHAIKERCEWMPDQSQCERCLRLQHVCETVRPKGRPGRKPGARGKQLSSNARSAQKPKRSKSMAHGNNLLSIWAGLQRMQRSGHPATIPESISELDFGDMPVGDQRLVRQFLFNGHLLDVFSVGSSFSERVRRQIIPHMLLSKTTFLDGLLACAMSWMGDIDDGQANPHRLSACYRHASSAIAILTSLQVGDFESMIDCLMLGALVSTFAVRLRLHDILAICRRTLGLIEPTYVASNPARPELRVFLSCIMVWELRACLFSCALPTVRFRPPAEPYADRHVGLSGTLLPLFYDICKLSCAVAQHAPSESVVLGELDAVEQSVRDWQPVVPEDMTVRFDTVEVTHMLCQAQTMQAAALLVIHRLRHPFGVSDDPAQVLSMTILTQIEMTVAVTKRPVRCIDLPLLVACIELKGTRRQKWSSDVCTFAGFSPQFGKHVRDTLESYWAAIDAFDTISWNDLVALGSPFLRNPEAT